MILKGDCIKVMKAMKPNSVDAIVTDPPYGLEFMGKEWDKLEKIPKGYIECEGKKSIIKKKMPRFHQTVEHNSSMQLWHTQWLTEAYRVLKPGGSMLVMGGTRTSHRLACAIEDSGFIIKDTLMWLYGSGFPKAQDLGKMIDKRNGRKVGDYKKLGEYLRQQRGDRPQKDIAKFFLSKTGGLTGCVANWEMGLNVPIKSQWQILKRELSLDDKFDWLIEREEAEREKIGKNKHWGQAGNSIGIGGQEWDLSLANTDLAKHWDGFKVGGIKPAYEPIIWSVKPPEGSYVDNVLKWGVGAVNVDECRVGYVNNKDKRTPYKADGSQGGNNAFHGNNKWGESKDYMQSKGRFPANVVLSHHPECVQVGVKRVKTGNPDRFKGTKAFPVERGWNQNKIIVNVKASMGDPDGLETVESWDCHPDCAIFLLNEQSGNTVSRFFKTIESKITVESLSHLSIAEIARQLGKDRKTTRELLKKKGLYRKPKKYIPNNDKERICEQCEILKPIEAFSKWRSNGSFGRRHICKDCHNENCLPKTEGDLKKRRLSKLAYYHNTRGIGRLETSLTREQIEQLKSIGRCAYCGAVNTEFHIDHVIPVSKGGKTEMLNLVLACASCNYSKNDRDLEKWFREQSFFDETKLRFLYTSKASRGERNAGLEGMEEKEAVVLSHGKAGRCSIHGKTNPSGLNTYSCGCPIQYGEDRKAIKSHRNNHPTVKPIKLFEWLIKLVTREGQIVLDPFIGSGTTAIAAHNAGRKCVGIEKEGEYLEIARRRISYWKAKPQQLSLERVK